MAILKSIAATGRSLERQLNRAFVEGPVPVANRTTRAFVIRPEVFDQ